MSGAELAEKIENLSPDDYNMVIMLVDRLAGNRIDLPRKSEDQLVKEMEESIKKSNAGHTRPAAMVSKEMREKYAL